MISENGVVDPLSLFLNERMSNLSDVTALSCTCKIWRDALSDAASKSPKSVEKVQSACDEYLKNMVDIQTASPWLDDGVVGDFNRIVLNDLKKLALADRSLIKKTTSLIGKTMSIRIAKCLRSMMRQRRSCDFVARRGGPIVSLPFLMAAARYGSGDLASKKHVFVNKKYHLVVGKRIRHVDFSQL